MQIKIGEIIVDCNSSEEAIKLIKGLGSKVSYVDATQPVVRRTYRSSKRHHTAWTEEALTVLWQNKHLSPPLLARLPQLKVYSKSAIGKASWAVRKFDAGVPVKPGDKRMTQTFKEVFTKLRDRDTRFASTTYSNATRPVAVTPS